MTSRSPGASRVPDDESLALSVAALAFGITALVALIVFGGAELPIDGRGSLGEFTAIAGAVSAAAAFAVSRIARARRDGPEPQRARYRWFDLFTLSLAHGAIALLGWIGAATVMDHSFVGATVFASPAVVLAAAGAAVSAYLSYLSGSALSPRQLSIVLAVFLVVGVVAAMLSSNDPQWWQMNLSALGMTHDISSLTFNLTLIVSGVIVTIVARQGTSTMPAESDRDRRSRAIVRALFVLLGILLACVGVFPVDRFFLLHNTVATGMAFAFAGLVIGLPWLVPTMPRVFLVLGFVYLAVVAALALLFAVGIYNLTAVELIASVLIFSWIILFLRNVQVVPAAARAATTEVGAAT